MIYGFQDQRKGDFGERLSGNIAYRLFNALLSHPIPRNHITVRLMKREYVDSLLCIANKKPSSEDCGLSRVSAKSEFQSTNKVRKETTYSIWHRWLKLIDSVASFSETPLVAIFYLGIAHFRIVRIGSDRSSNP